MSDLLKLRDELRRRVSHPYDHLPKGVSIELAEVGGKEVVLVVSDVPPQFTKPEPTVDIVFGGIVAIRVGLTFLHHLNNHGGWRGGRDGDRVMSLLMEEIERGMWKSLEPLMLTEG